MAVPVVTRRSPARLRVVAGTAKGRRLTTPPGIRPTAEKVKEAMFSRIAERIEGARVLDLYAGSGALGIEALSRGASEIVLVDCAGAAVRAIRANLRACRFEDRAQVIAAGAEGYLAVRAGAQFDLALADPPYDDHDAPRVLGLLGSNGHLTPDALVILERAARGGPIQVAGLELVAEYPYGDTMLVHLRPRA